MTKENTTNNITTTSTGTNQHSNPSFFNERQQYQGVGGIKLGIDVGYDDVYANEEVGLQDYVTELVPSDDDEEENVLIDSGKGGATHPSSLQQQQKQQVEDDSMNYIRNGSIQGEGAYQKQRFHAEWSGGTTTSTATHQSYKEIMLERQQQQEQEVEEGMDGQALLPATVASDVPRRRRRWDDPKNESTAAAATTTLVSDTESTTIPPQPKRRKRWDETPLLTSTKTTVAAIIPDSTTITTTAASSDSTPFIADTPRIISHPTTVTTLDSTTTAVSSKLKRSRWDTTPLVVVPSISTGVIPTTTVTQGATKHGEEEEDESGFIMRSEEQQQLDREIQATSLGISLATPSLQQQQQQQLIETPDGLPFIKQEDLQFFGKLLVAANDPNQPPKSKEELNELKITTLLLKIKSGTPPQRKTAMRQITEKAPQFGAAALFNQLLPLLMSPTLEDQERHLLVKVVDRILYRLDDLVRPHVSQILAVMEPLLVDEDYYTRVEGREIISNLAKAAGLPTMIATMRPDLDNPDEYVRNTTARAFAVVATALGVSQLLPFLRAVCQSKKSWQARHTGIKIVQQIAILQGCAVLPHLRDLVDIVAHGLVDEHQRKIRTITALTLAALAESSFPYGIESFDSVIRPLWKGALEHHSKLLASFLKAIGYIIPLMEENYASHYTKLVMPILIREFHSPDEEMKRIVLRVIQQCVATAGVDPDYIRTAILPEFFRNFWVRRMALDRRNHKQVVETTVELSNKVGASDIISRIVDDLKDDSEPYRRMVMETMQKVLENLGAGDIDERLEERLIDGMLYAFQEQAVEASESSGGLSYDTSASSYTKDGQVMLDGFGAVVNALGVRCKPYLKQIVGTIKWRLNNKSASVRMQASDLIARIAVVMKACGEDSLMGHLGVVLYEYLGEEYPDVLGSILGALKSIVNVIGMTKMTPPIRDLLPRLTPILRNRHEKVQENCIDLVR
jgi:splicing factor 3B subunit 1